MNNNIYTQIEREKCYEIIDSRKPLGKFYYEDEEANLFIGVDNSYHEAITEEFSSLELCMYWLENEGVSIEDIYEIERKKNHEKI